MPHAEASTNAALINREPAEQGLTLPKQSRAGKVAIFRETGHRFQRQNTSAGFHQQLFDALEATWQLVAPPPALALVVFQVLGPERQRALAGLQEQGRAGRQH